MLEATGIYFMLSEHRSSSDCLGSFSLFSSLVYFSDYSGSVVDRHPYADPTPNFTHVGKSEKNFNFHSQQQTTLVYPSCRLKGVILCNILDSTVY
jgi:hypothetical protein